MLFLIVATSSDPNWDGDCDLGRIVIDRFRAWELLKFKRVFDSAHRKTSKAGPLWEMYYWDSSISFIQSGPVPALQRIPTPVDPWTRIEDEGIEIKVLEIERESTEVEQLIVRKDGVAWTGLIKHTSVYAITEVLPWAVLRKIADRKKPKKRHETASAST